MKRLNLFKLFHSEKGEDSRHAYHTKLEKKLDKFIMPFQKHIKSQVIASAFLLICTVVAIFWANTPFFSETYTKFVNTPIGFNFSNFSVQKPLSFWVNDFLLTFFFFFVGLEIKREFLVGELAKGKKALLVLFAAFGGMLIPGLIYFAINFDTPTKDGWGIPMATDTAFALGVLFFFKNKLSKGIFTFIAALAIIDDIGAIILIAVFYSENINSSILIMALCLVLTLFLLNFMGFRKPFFYIVLGFLLWILVEYSGVHATVSGVLVAFLIPARPQKGPKNFVKRIKELLDYFEKRREKKHFVLKDNKQHAILEEVQEIAQQSTTTLQYSASKLELPISLIILPLFALVNAGIPIHSGAFSDIFTKKMPLGIFLGLFVGKPLGVSLFSYVALKLNFGELPKKTKFCEIFSVSFFTGIGFTMSLFIANLSFEKESDLLLAKTTILLTSFLGCFFSFIFLLLFLHRTHKN